ncbi:von Willebrand factor A domain-containing protein 7-like [Mizuhopecten yessoensis]|uniref:von Willebrand factor A domain-containing protein 7 n=1 Tax=Mizuhopecten yessoensis TaxID=6573 RepID=A0A210PMZ8_MIZYE|nr:von Willebrand factor A domain-containing protein 7-like [Mizuhopecten yessoensis]OWF37843.1 von Willebrand factor A domain-containing protein 7 [Mizuhopecten yessoensis]
MMKGRLTMLSLCLFLTSAVTFIEAFNPNTGLSDDTATYTHQRITVEAIDRIAADFLLTSNQVTTSQTTEYDFVIKEHFESDSDSYENYKNRAQQFANAVSNVYQSYRTNPDYTVNSERILEAHKIVQDTRLEIASILSSETLTDTAVTLLVEKLGKCLMIIQSFYSNTNWVEMNGRVAYTDFGSLAAQSLMQIASSSDATCRTCDDSRVALNLGSCNDNLVLTDRLTSGYLSGQLHSPKPTANPAHTTGKCSHGGVKDSGRITPAAGGINKETTDWDFSPHAHLHNDASEAAIQATVAFFMDPTTGILTDKVQTTVATLLGLQLKSTPSLAFAIDVSGSMGDDIASVKEVLRAKVNEVKGTERAPGKYVLATFNDPASLTEVTSTTDGDEMIRLIDNLIISGGGDCPEYAISGIRAAIRLSEPNSKIIVATDADAKDSIDTFTAISEANAKTIRIEFLLTGSCTRRRRVAPARYKRNLATFQSIAASTGGTVYQIGSGELSTILNQLLQEDFASSTAVVDYFVQTTSESNSMDVHVDSETTNLVITISGPYSSTHATLSDPTGTVQTFSTEGTTRYYSSNTITMTIQNPTPGTWVLTRLLSRRWEVNVTVSSAIDIDIQLIETDDTGIYYVSNRNPIIGKNYTIAVVVYNLNSSSTSFALNILDEEGTVNYNTPIDLNFGPSKITGYTSIVIPSTSFYVQLSGTDQDGFQFKRTLGTSITPVGVDLFIQPIFGNLAIGTPQNITYTLSNQGSTTETYTVSIVDDKGRILSPTSQQHSVSAGNDTTGIFQLTSTIELEYITYTVSVTTFGSSTVLQSTTYTAMFAGSYCSAFMTSQCSGGNTGSSNCSLSNWSAKAAFSFDVTTFIVTDNVTVSIDGTDRTRLLINGTCCITNFTVNAFPTTGSGCQASQSVVGSVFQSSTDDVSDQEDADVTSAISTNIGLIVGVLVGVAVLIIGATALLKHVTSKQTVVKDDGVIAFNDDKHADISGRTHFDPKTLNPKSLEIMLSPAPPRATTLRINVRSRNQFWNNKPDKLRTVKM